MTWKCPECDRENPDDRGDCLECGLEEPPPPKTVKTMDNIEWMAHVANFSDHGALMQVFMLDALYKYATKVASMDVKDVEAALEGQLIPGHAWHGTAKELVRRFEERAS